MPSVNRALARASAPCRHPTPAPVGPSAPFAQVAADKPEHEQGADQALHRFGIPVGSNQERAARRFACSASSRDNPAPDPARRHQSRPLRPALDTTRRACDGSPPLSPLVARLLEPKLADGFQHPEARLSIQTLALTDQALVDQGGNGGPRTDRVARPGWATASIASNVPPPAERWLGRRNSALCSLGFEEVIAPGNRVPQGLLTCGADRGRASGQQGGPDRFSSRPSSAARRQYLEPGRGEFDRQGKPVEARHRSWRRPAQ